MERLGVVSRRVLARLVAANDNLEWKGAGAVVQPSPGKGSLSTESARLTCTMEAKPAGAVISPSKGRPAPGVAPITAETLPPDSVRSGAGKERPGGEVSRGRRQLGGVATIKPADEDG